MPREEEEELSSAVTDIPNLHAPNTVRLKSTFDVMPWTLYRSSNIEIHVVFSYAARLFVSRSGFRRAFMDLGVLDSNGFFYFSLP